MELSKRSIISVDQRVSGSRGLSCGVIGQLRATSETRYSGVRDREELGGAKGLGARLVPEAHEGEGETGVE